MRKLGLGTALAVIAMLTAAATGIQYLGYQLVGLPFSPLDLYDWLVRSGSGLWVSLISSLKGFFLDRGQTAADTAGTTEWLLGLGLFFALAMIAGLIFYLFVGRRRVLPDGIDGVTIGAVLGVPLLLVSLFAGRSLVNPVFVIIWVLGLFLLWGIALSFSFRRLMRPVPLSAVSADLETQTQGLPVLPADDSDGATPPLDAATAARLDRRHFLFQLGASTAAITAIGATAGTLLANENANSQALRPFPIADAEFLARQSALVDNFRRFAIVSFPPDRPEAAEVVTLGAEYPDRAYVSVWLGEGSPIVIYESLETVLSAYATDDTETTVLWLDK